MPETKVWPPRKPRAVILEAIDIALALEFQRGSEAGVQSIEKILGWTTRKPKMSLGELQNYVHDELTRLRGNNA
jgi:hypothetical protein